MLGFLVVFFFFQAEDGIRDGRVTGVQTCALPILRGAWKISLGNTVNATGTERFAGFFPAASAAKMARKFSQYSRADEAAVFVSQCSMMLSTTRSGVRPPATLPSRNAREIFS